MRPEAKRSTGSRLLFAVVVAVPFSDASAADPLPPGAASCSACHGADEAGAPAPLASLSADAIVAALAAYRSGEREGTIMPRLAKGFSDAEMRAIAAAVGRGGPR